ncbi:LrgB family protein [Celerinatantimonas diazotrophica]|uniref:Putative murein hydrolase (TIGR00659 family) n=1 Tax=Celerinatantimonas diazotrophica TaxID=412034 RepID=A0A4R1JLT2_9GAMM|nr:LrgB family protein [Celerinatantimonas diazotrophica]TCK52024.1 putative murein hydrolase (TIGR00659 family) [Celerinatantimonas diazotrophica]CAG9296273.1 Inner membrane protein YohK [Celerinatantimonas diazotrophica]
MNNSAIALGCFVLTIVLYLISKWLYHKKNIVLFMPLLLAPVLILIVVLALKIPYKDYIQDSHWLLWMLGPATVAFAIPIYDQRQLIARHWLSLTVGVCVAVLVAVTTSVMLARLFHLTIELQRSLAMRSITTPFAIQATKIIGGQTDLNAVFVVITGVLGMAIGEFTLTLTAIRSRLGKGASLGACAHGAGTAKAYQLGHTEGVTSSVIMMLAGVITVCAAPLIGHVFW